MMTGFCTIGLKARALEKALDVAARSGFDGVELWGREPHMGELFDEKRVQAARAAVEERGLSPLVFGSYVGSLREGIETDLKRGREAVRITRAFGSPVMRVWAGSAGSTAASSEHRRDVISFFKALCDEAALYCLKGTATGSAVTHQFGRRTEIEDGGGRIGKGLGPLDCSRMMGAGGVAAPDQLIPSADFLDAMKCHGMAGALDRRGGRLNVARQARPDSRWANRLCAQGRRTHEQQQANRQRPSRRRGRSGHHAGPGMRSGRLRQSQPVR